MVRIKILKADIFTYKEGTIVCRPVYLNHTSWMGIRMASTITELTLYMIANLGERLLLLQLGLMDNTSSCSCSRPVGDETIITSDPLCADISIDLNRMSASIVRRRCDRKVRKGKWLFDEISWLCKQSVRYRWLWEQRLLTSMGLRKVTVRSTGPADRTNMLWVAVIYQFLTWIPS